MNDPANTDRRRLLLLGLLALPASTALGATLRTPSASEGPFYPTTAMRYDDIDNDLVKIAGEATRSGGKVVQLTGRVLDSDGKPLAGARVEIWQCDANGRYLHRGDRGGETRDRGFQGFGHDITRADGVYRFRTIEPVPYPGRTPHIHLKVWLGGRARLTTQLYLPDHPDNQRDWLYRRIPADKRELVTMRFDNSADEPRAVVDLVV